MTRNEQKIEAMMKMDAIRERVRRVTNLSEHDFCLIHVPCNSKPNVCDVCGSKFKLIALRLNGWTVCRDSTKCRSVAELIPRGRGDYALIKIIKEVTKHAGNDENKRRLEKHFIRHAG